MDTLCKMMQRISTNHKRILNSMVENYGLTYAQYLVLRHIEETQTTLAQDIIIALDSDKATISGIISRLFNKGWIEKYSDLEDKRKINIALSDSGKKKLAKIHHLKESCESVLLHSFNPKDSIKIKLFLAELIQNQDRYLIERGVSHA